MLDDMPCHVRPHLDAFPKSPGFLRPDAAEEAGWRTRFASATSLPSVGFCWRSGLRRPAWRHNDLVIAQLAPLFGRTDFLPVCLQYDEYEAEIQELEKLTGVPVFRPEAIDQRDELDRVAAMIAALDLVIATDTSVLFIAGAVGTPVIGLHASRSAMFLGASSNPWLASERSLIKGGNRSWEAAINEALPLIEEILSESG
ncbi:glycosyltransferase family 9 protein [Nisaea sp.]|uniref:glycosyltransferase family 9 protein n=1 Tax=Nisaea sp. TaxID=2024842 RepID=UPI003B5288F8